MSGMKVIRAIVGALALVVAAVYLIRVVDGGAVTAAMRALLADPLGLAVALVAYAAAFGLRTWSWRAVLPGLSLGQGWAALHVSLLGNHVLPFRLGEALRVTSVLRRTSLGFGAVLASAVTLRAADLLAVLVLALVAAPGLVAALAGGWAWAGVAVLSVLVVAGMMWLARVRDVRLPGVGVAVAAGAAWALESAVVWEIARAAGSSLTVAQAVAVTAVTIAAQVVAVTPGGFGSYEAAATAALVALGVPAGPAFAIALTTHAVKTVYSLVVGGVALVVPAPTYWGLLRLPRVLPARPERSGAGPGAPVVAFIPAYNEEEVVGGVIRRLPATVGGRPLVTIVVDDGSTDASAECAAEAGRRCRAAAG